MGMRAGGTATKAWEGRFAGWGAPDRRRPPVVARRLPRLQEPYTAFT